jgi:hypothetical protein
MVSITQPVPESYSNPGIAIEEIKYLIAAVFCYIITLGSPGHGNYRERRNNEEEC